MTLRRPHDALSMWDPELEYTLLELQQEVAALLDEEASLELLDEEAALEHVGIESETSAHEARTPADKETIETAAPHEKVADPNSPIGAAVTTPSSSRSSGSELSAVKSVGLTSPPPGPSALAGEAQSRGGPSARVGGGLAPRQLTKEIELLDDVVMAETEEAAEASAAKA